MNEGRNKGAVLNDAKEQQHIRNRPIPIIGETERSKKCYIRNNKETGNEE